MPHTQGILQLHLYIALSLCSFLKASERLFLARSLDTLEALTVLSIEDISVMLQRRLTPHAFNRIKAIPPLVEKTYALMERYHIHTTFHDDLDFPPLLREIADKPFFLYYRGVLPNPEIPAVALVGTRRPTGLGMKTATQLGKECGQEGIPVISGLARGIDAFSHRGTLDTSGTTAAVLACGVDQFYPITNRQLAGHILEQGGCILSEYAPGEPPFAYRFPQRNRIISGLARSVVVVEAPAKSGALITADFALEQGRDVYVCKPLLDSRQNTGGKRLAEEGALAIEHARDILYDWETPSLRQVYKEKQIPLFAYQRPVR
ncbi:MAG: DNA-processing protein DprA [Treponema sp.]